MQAWVNGLKATIKCTSHIYWFEYILKQKCHRNIKFHHRFIYPYQTRILMHNTSLNIKVLRLLPSYFLTVATFYILYSKYWQELTYIYATLFALVLNDVLRKSQLLINVWEIWWIYKKIILMKAWSRNVDKHIFNFNACCCFIIHF